MAVGLASEAILVEAAVIVAAGPAASVVVGGIVGMAVGATANSGAGVGEGAGAGAGSPQATLVITASARTPMTKYLFNSLLPGAGSACLGADLQPGRIISYVDPEATVVTPPNAALLL